MIRRAAAGDIPALVSLLREILLVHHRARPDLFRSSGQKYDEAALSVMLQNPALPIFVYEEAGTVLGYVMCQEQFFCSDTQLPVKTLYIDDLCVDSSCRHRGIGKKLFEYACSYAREKGFYNVTLHSWDGNPGAMAFYRAMGMQTQYTTLELVLTEDRP